MTKYKPLYALYKGLKEHGTDLPDSYGSFERSMTQAGNAGASNRRNFYQSLKDSNYDVPDTYEKFYESMFVPVNNTTSRARKIGETPITDEDRKGFTLGAQDIRMNASKFAAGDALRYNKLKQRKQKQRKDFGRVKVGTNKTPYAPTDNVVKDEGLNTYVTSDSSDTTNLDYAQQKQAVLDEQNQAYMNAIERGDIPMASETIDKNGLYDLQENIGKDGTEVTEKGIKEQAEARLNVAYQKQKDIMAQLSAAMDGGFSTFEERMQLSATKNKIDEEVRNLEALAGKESSGFWNTLADVANTIPLLHNIKEVINYLFGDDTSKDMYKAIANSMVQSNWDFGVSDIQNSVKLEQIRDKINKGEAVTKEEKEFLDANQKADKSAEWVDQYGSRAYRWTSGAGVSVPYMIDFYITGGLPLMRGMTQAFGRGAMKIAAKRGWGKLAHNIMYYTGVAAGDIIGSYAMATTVQGLKTGSDVLNRHLGTLYQDEKGNYAFGTFDENGNLLHEGGESFGKALYKGVTAAMLENYTEKMFGHWHLKSGAFDLLDKNPYTKKLADFFRGVGNKNWYLDTKKFSSKFGIGSYPEEVAEEIVNIPLNAWLVGDNSIKELGDRKTWEDIAGSMAISVGSMAGMASTPHIVRGAANQGIKAYDFAAFYVFKNRLNQANQRASEILGDEWEVIKNRIDSAPNENLGKISADLHKQVSEGKYSEEQLDAAWAYIQNLRVMRGYNLAKTMEMQAKAMTGDENTPADIRQKQLNAAYAAGQETEGENKHLAQVEYEKQKFNLASALGVSDSELENMTDEQISSNLGLDDNLDNVIYNYQNAKALYDGIIDNAQNAVDTATKVAAQRVDAMTNVEDGTIKQALVKGTMGKDDYPVYVISGNIETHDDGIINYSDSDSMIIVYNVATGRKETIPVSMLSAVNPYIQNAEEFKAQAVNEAKEKTITELSNVIDGKLVDGSQFTMEDARGQIHEYKIEGIDEQGNCIISVDGTILPEPLSLDAIQQQYDQSNVARSVKNDQTAQEPEQIQQESQPIEDKFDYAKITNENDGKVKRVDVTDEEGKNRFPNAKAVFLIQDKGAMPKFVVMDEEGNLTSYVGKRGDKIHLKGEMTIDEYKKQRQEELQMIAAENADSSMIEDNSGAIEVEDNEEGKLLNRNDDSAQTEQNQPSASVTTSQEDAAGSSESKDTNISANGNENNESLTFEDGTPIPVDMNGEVDLSQTDASHAAEWYDNNLGEDADDWLDGEIKKAKKVLEQAKNKKLAGTKPSELVASKKEKEAAIADAQAYYDSAISIRDSLKERRIAKEENTSEGRRNLIEKARRKFARLKSAVKDDAEAVSQLYRETIGSLLHRLYDGTGIDVTDTIPLTAEEYVASNLGAHSLNYEGTETSKGVKQETGLSREDFAKTQLLAADGKGTTIDALVHSLWENRPSNLESLDTQDIRNALIGVLNSGFKASEARNFVENIRIAQAENILEEKKRAQENAAYAEQHKAEPEAELKAKSDEKAELKAKSEAKLDNESDNKSNDLSNDLDNEKINDNINDNINTPEVPDDATEDNPLGAQRDSAPFSPKDNTKVTNSSEERKAMVKKNAVRSEDVLDHSIGKKMRKSLSRIAKMMGADIIYLHSADSNGWYDEKTNTIYLALDSADVLGTQFVFGHEMTHEIKAKNPAAFEELKNLVKNMMGEDAFNTITDKTQQKYEKGGATYWKDRNAMEEEVVADQIGNWIHDANYAHTLMMKMSHPLLAKLHEIVNRIRFAFTGTEYSDNAKLILRSIEQAYMKTANGQVTNSETGEDVSFSLRQKPEPKKIGVGYKVFVLKDGKLYPPMVANPDGAATPVGVWLDADAAPIAGESKTGRPQVKQGGKGTQGGSGKLAYRPGWHLGVVPYAIQFNRKDAEGNKTLFPKNFVFAEVEYAADVDYQEEARQEGINPSGKYQHSLAGLKHLPTDGYYMYRTNPNPETDPWVITGAMKVNRILTRAEQAELVKNAGREPQQIQEGDIVTDDVVNSINQEIADAPKFSLKVYHGSGADFTEFDFDHMGEGAGSQVFGWGGYVTSSEEIGKSYVELTRKKPTYVYNGKEMSEDDLRSVLLDKVGIDNANILDDFLYNLEKYGVSEAKSILRKGDYAYFKDLLKGTYGSVRSGYQNKVDAAELILAPRNIRVKKYKGNLYEVDIPEDNGSNYLDWDKPLSKKQQDSIREGLEHLGVGIKTLESKGQSLERTGENIYNSTLYIGLTGTEYDLPERTKGISKFLSFVGFTGIKYKAGRNFGGAKKGDTNYVIFKPEDMKITQHTKFSLKSKPVRFETGKKLSDEEKKEVLSTLKDAYKVNGVPYHIEETAGGKEKRVYEPTADSYVVSDITNRPLRYYITLPDGRVAHPTEVYPNISDNEVKSSATKQGLLDDEADHIVSAAIGNMKGIADNAKVLEVLTKMQNLPHETHDVGYGMNNAQSYNYKTGIFTSDAAQAIDYVVRRMRRKEDVPVEIPAALKKAVDDSYGMVDNLIDGMSNTKVGAAEIKPVGVGAFGNIYNQFRGKAKAAIEFLKKVRGGEAVGALHHKDIGDIDLVWGKEGTGHSDGYGLSKLVKYHPEVLDNLQEILNDMRVVSSSKNRVNLESETHKAGVRLTWDGERKSWLLTAFKKETSASDKRTDTAATSLEGDTALSQTEGSAAKIDNSSETAKENGEKFSLKDEKTMFGMHNISVDKLRKAIKQGGFAAPSMGVVDSKNGIYSDYGEITLIPKAEKLAKRTGKNAGTFTADAWTPTYPQVERIMNKQGEKAFNTDMNVKLGDVDNGIYSNVRESWKGYLSSGDVRDGLYWHYLFDNGMNPETIYQTGKYDNDITNEVMRISDNGNKKDYTDKEVAELIQLMNKATGKDNDVDAQREKLKARIASAEKQGNHLLVALKKKRLEELEGVENFYIAADFVNDVVRNNRKNGKVDVHDTMGAAKKKVEDNKKLSDDFPSWLDKKTEEYGVEEMLYNGTTPSGKPKYIPNTIDNAVKLMKKQGVAGGYTAFGSELGVFIAKNSPEVNTLAAMKNAKDKLIPFGDERHNQIKDKITKEFLELSDEIRVGSNNRYAFDDSGVSRMVELTDHKGNEKEYLKKAYNIEVSDEWMDRYNKLLDTIKKDYKVFYFETKFMRPYGLDEFEKAIVPSDTPSDVIDALKKAGIDVSSYERGNAEDRQKVTMDAINSSDNIRFSLAGERGAAAADKAEERTFRMDNLSVARKMEEKKKDAKAIKMATGWERGADGKWRYEMPDAKIKDTMDVGGGHIVKRYEDDMLWNGGKLFDVIDAPELFKAYPQLKGVRIDTDAIMNDMPSHGEYDSKTNTITIHADELKYMNDILNHEIQHAIQGIEGFATGGSPTTIRGEVKKRFNEVTKQIKQLRAEGKEDEAKALIEKNRGLYDAYMKNDDFNSYKSLAGEVEARNVQERMNMTPEERRKTLAESTEDVARKDQIFLGVGDVSFSIRDMADGKESGAADMAEDLKSLNTPDEVDDAIKTAIEDMPSGWKMANKKMIHIAQALGENRKAEIAGEEPKFSLKDGTLIKAGTYFSGGGLVEEGLKGIIDPVVAVEYDEKISGVYRNNFGQHIVTADVRDVDPKELVKQIDGEVEYFHASPVCKNYSQAKSNHAEVELDKETAASTAEFINAIKPKVVTIENVKGYKDSEAMKTITDALDANGYTWDADVYNAADYGGYTNRERLIVRAVRDGKLPAKPEKMARKSGWYEAVADIIPTLTEKKNGVAPWMDIRLKADGIDWRNIDKPLYVMGSAYADGKVPHAFADELLPTLRTKSGDVIVMPDGKVYRAMGRVLARVSGVSDDYKMPFSENLSHTIIGNGIPTQLTEHVIAPLLTGSDPKFSIRTYHGTGASFDKFDLSHALEGEGSETFGHGVYVTNSSKIGREYAQRAKQRKMADLYKNMRYPDGVKDDIFKRRVFGEMVNDVATGGSVASAKEFAKKRVGADANDIQRTLENLKDREKGTEYEQNLKDRLAEYKDALKWIDSIDEDYLTQGNANRYDVDIPDDNGSNYLDWDAPLTDKQKNTIIKELRRLKIDFADFKKRGFSFDGSFGGNAYDFLMYALRKTKKWKDVNASRAVSKFLSSIGFTGIKYKAGSIFGGAKEGDYNYVIFDENNANIVGNTKFSLRGSTPYDKQMEEWMEKNHLEKGAVPMEKPIMKEGENIFDYANRMVEWTRNQNLWKTAPKQTGFQDALDKWKADNGLSPDAYPPVRPHRENYSTEIGYAEDLEEYNKKKELWKSAPKPKDFDLSVDLEDMNKQLRNIRRAVLNQKNYDQRTVKAVSDLVRKMLNIGWGDGLSRGKVGNLLSAAKNATGANDVKKYLDKAMGILAENYLNRLSTAYDNLINTKGARADQSGVIKMGSLDAKGQAFMSEYKKAMNMDDKSLNTYIANIEEDSAKNEDNVEMNDYRLAGIQAAIMYKQQIGGNDADIAELKRQIGELKNKKDATKEDKDLLKSLEKKLFENKFDRITMYENLLNNIQRMVKESKGRAKEFREEITEHKNEILHRANLDLEGVDSAYYDTTTAKKKFVNNPILRFVMSSTYTFEQFLKFFGRHHANGEGYLYNYFMSEWQDAADEQQLYNEMNRNALDEKTKELFGKKNFTKLVGIDGKGMKEMDVEVTDYSNKETGKRTIHLKQGQMLYIYLVNKETDGEMKLRAMGITEEKVAEIEENLDPRVKAMGEWLQDEYLPECQRRYQATHTKYFGAPMKEVENYFPLAINNRARNIREDLNQDTDAISRLAGTSTGAIITRRVNVIPLDIENADAFAVAYNHLDEMEEWSAYLPFIQDVNTLLSSTHFRNQVMNMSSAAYGSGKTLWEEFKKVAQIAAGTYKPKVDNGMMDSKIAAVVGGIATAKISGRLWTAFKQTQSATTFLTECDPARFLWYGVNPYGSWHWAYDNLPLFRKRVEQLTAGDVKVRQFLDELEKYHDWTKTIAKVGMSPNILVDSVTCAVGARSVYETELNKLTKLGYSKDKAEEKAIQKASLSYNKTQQSSEGAFLSPMQVDRTYVSAALSLYKNANYAYGRKKIEAIRGIAKTYRFWGEHKNAMIGSMTRQIMDEDGLDENVANAIAKRAYTRTFWYNIGTLLNYMTIVPISWAAYKVLLYLLNGDDDDKKKKMIEEACLKGFATTTFDDYVIPFASNVLNAGLNIEDGKIGFDTDVFKYQNLYINPATSDLSNIYSMIGNQKWWSAGNKFGMLGIQMLVGFNPETIGALYQAYDEFDKDSGNMPLEIKLAVLKSISAPEESIRGLYMDELGLDNDDRTKVPLSVLEQRYAERQINRDNLLSQIAMPKETFDGYVEKYKKSFEKKIQDKMDKMDAYDQRKFDAIFDTTTDPALKGMMEKKRTKDANAAADEQIAKEGLNQEKKGKEPSEEAYDAVKMSIDVAEDNAISTYNKVLNKRYAALNDEYNNQTDAMKYIFMSKHPNFKSYKDLESEYTTYGKKMKELKEKLVSADGYDAKQTILKQIRVEREKFSELQSKVR